jgi:hypothetical protein
MWSLLLMFLRARKVGPRELELREPGNMATRVLTVDMLGIFSMKLYHVKFVDTFRIIAI